jgi:hypothetical protein
MYWAARYQEEISMTTPVSATQRPGTTVESTSEFSLFFTIKPGHADELREALRTMAGLPGYRPGDHDLPIATIHEARFVIFDDDTRLLFATSFDGPWEAYIEDFASKSMATFDSAFQHLEGYEGASNAAEMKKFIADNQVTADAYARNYPGTVKEIRKAQRVDAAFQEALDHSSAEQALRHPALKPLLDEAGD